ncbi:MAG TPA: immunoglobulin domain-containing protein, partial [Verrucomicrobiae bacterium]
MTRPKWYLISGLFLAAAMLSARAGSFFSDFNTGDLPPGTHTNANSFGGAYLELNGGIGDSGCLKLTKNINSQNGSFILDDLDAGQPIYGFDATFKIRIGGGSGTPADGFSFVVAPDLQDTSNFGESGAGSGVRFCWDIYSNPDTPPAPRVYVAGGSGGTIVAWKGYTIAGITTSGADPSTWWTDVHIRLNADGALTLDYKGVNVFTNFFIPGYQDIAALGIPMRFGLGARTGGLNANQWIDNLQITTFTTPLVGISQQPFDQTAQQGDDVQFDVRVGNNTGVTYQWFYNGGALTGATDQTLKIAAVQPSNAGKYKVTATGPNNAVTSTEVTLGVTNLTLPATAQLAFNFNDGAVPAGTTILGTALVDTTGGVGGSGCLKLATAINDQDGAIVISDPNAGAAVYGFTARFQTSVGGGGTRPADGFAFAFGSDIPDAPTGTSYQEGQGLGTGLRVSMDNYDNDNIFGYVSAEPTLAPSIDVRWGSQIVATAHLPLSFVETSTNPFDPTPVYADTIVQLNTDGTLNVVYHGDLVFDHLPIPSFSSISGGRFALAARTGGAYDNFWFDNIEITSVTTPGSVRIYGQSGNQTILINHAMTNTVTVVDPAGVAYQWYRGSTAISGATDSAYVLSPVALADSGAIFTATASKASVTVTSA